GQRRRGAGGGEAAWPGARGADRPPRGAALGARRGFLPALLANLALLRPRASRVGGASPLLHAGLRTGAGPPRGESLLLIAGRIANCELRNANCKMRRAVHFTIRNLQ